MVSIVANIPCGDFAFLGGLVAFVFMLLCAVTLHFLARLVTHKTVHGEER